MVTPDFPRRVIVVTTALAVLAALLALGSLGTGPVRLSPLTVIDALFGGGSDVQQTIVREIRLPRTILGLAIGGVAGHWLLAFAIFVIATIVAFHGFLSGARMPSLVMVVISLIALALASGG